MHSGRVFWGRWWLMLGWPPRSHSLLAPQSPETTCPGFCSQFIPSGPRPRAHREPTHPSPSRLQAAFCSLCVTDRLQGRRLCRGFSTRRKQQNNFYYSGPALGEEGSSPGEGAWPPGLTASLTGSLLSVRLPLPQGKVTELCFLRTAGSQQDVNRGGTWIASV